MKYAVILLFSILYSAQIFSAENTLQSPPTLENKKYEESIDENNKKITFLTTKLTKHEEEFKAHINNSEKITLKLNTDLKLHSQEYSQLKDSTESLRNTAWNYLSTITNIFYGVLGLVIALAGIFIWRENSTMQQKLKNEENEIQQQKLLISKERGEAKKMIEDAKKEIAISLDSLKRRSNILIQIQSEVVNENEIYADIMQLLQFSNFENYTVLKRLLSSQLLSSKLHKELEKYLSIYKKELLINKAK